MNKLLIALLINNTDMLVFDDLEQMGIPKSDLVIGFLPEYGRRYSGYAVPDAYTS